MTMSSEEFRKARQLLRLSINDTAAILDVSSVTIRRWEMTSGKESARQPHPTACQVLRWLKSGKLKL